MACLAPELRFDGYTDAWEQRKLSELYIQSGSGGTPTASNPAYYDGPIPFLSIADIESRDITSTKKTLTELGLLSSTTWLVPAGAVALAMYASVGKVGIIRQETATSQAFFNMVFESDVMRDFVYCRLEKAELFEEWEPFISTGTQRNLNAEKVQQWELYIPSDDEMRAIGSTLISLDNLITLHQREYDKLVTTKQAMLQKMFPKPGEDVPEVRFEGFEEAWRWFKLGELLFFQNGFNGSSDSFGCGTPLISVMDVLGDGFITHDTIRGQAQLSDDELKRFAVEYGDVLFQRSSENFEDAGTSNVYLDETAPAAFGGFVIRGKKIADYDPVFIKYLLATAAVRQQITSRAQGAQHINVSQNTLADVDVRMPSMGEQKAIGATMKNMDDLASLRQDELKMLKQLKSALLQKMFV